MYCAQCKIAFGDSERCPSCGSRKIRDPLPDDLCFLTETELLFGGMLKDVLKQQSIPVLSSSTIGAGMAMRGGTMLERIRFFVRYEHLPKAAEIVEELFLAPDGSEEAHEAAPGEP